jgi:hypothetical protein
MYWQTRCAVFLCAVMVAPVVAQTPNPSKTRNAACTFSDGKQIRVTYAPLRANSKEEFSNDKLWSPGGRPMFFFTPTDVSIEGKDIPPGAYAMYIIPNDDKWTLVLNRDVTTGAKYDEKQDLLRASMQIGHLNQPQDLTVAFGRMAPKQCNVRIYYGKVGTWAEFKEH